MGVRARDVLHDTRYDFASDVVINAAGPWCREVARRFDRDVSELNRYSIAWNILFNREAPSDCALGVRPPGSGARLQFLHPWKGRLLAGTGHAPREAREEVPQPSPDEIRGHLDDLNEAIPELKLSPQDILHVYAGYLPVQQSRGVQLAKEDRFVDHAIHGGPSGLYSVQSTKLTAARRTAERVLSEVFPDRSVTPAGKKIFHNMQSKRTATRGVWDYAWYPNEESSSWRKILIQIMQEESVHHLDDLMLRRTSLGDNPVRALNLAPTICELFDWDEARCRAEIRRIEDHFRWLNKSPKSHVNE
jgi:glycerol-3-phosphate dehydrogenase